MALASYPGFFCTTPPTEANPFGVYWPTLVPADVPKHAVVLEDGTRIADSADDRDQGSRRVSTVAAAQACPARPAGPTRARRLGAIFGARSGDKGGNANVGIWARDEAGYAWLASYLTIERFKQLMPEAAHLEVRRYELPNLRALNFVVVGLLGEGVASSIRFDPQAKSLGEFLRLPRSRAAAGAAEQRMKAEG